MTPGSFIRLGYYFLKRLLARLFGNRGGLPLFQENYVVGDNLIALAPAERVVLPQFSRCIGCGACDVHAESQRPRVAGAPGPSALPLAFARNLPDLDALRSTLVTFEGLDLEGLERLCPTRVPFPQLVAFARAHAGEATRARPATALTVRQPAAPEA